jgi:CRISPR-associated protein Cas2
MRFIVAYDITSTRRRNKLVRILEKFGQRVQYSIFECELTPAGAVALRAELRMAGFMTGKYGAVFLYPFDENTLRGIERYGSSLTIDKPAVIVT